jgi:hypothetical protein
MVLSGASVRIVKLSLAAILLCPSLVRSQDSTGPRTRADIIRHIKIYESQSEYCAWPSIARTSGGDLVVLFTRTEEHLGPDSAILLTRSTDDGKTWLRPVVVLDSPLDDRESGVTTLRDGWIVGHFWSTFHTRESYESLAPNGDLGYPASVELERGVILTVYYQPDVPPGTIQCMNPPDPHRTKPGILGTIWRVPPERQFSKKTSCILVAQ